MPDTYQIRPLKSYCPTSEKVDFAIITSKERLRTRWRLKFPRAACQTGGDALWLRRPQIQADRERRPYNGAALSSSEPLAKAGTVFCRSCGKAIEAGARFCRFCGKSQLDPVGGSASTAPSSAPARQPAGAGLEHRLRQIFPRHHLQDEFTHAGTIAAFLMALIGFVVGFFINYSWLGTNFLLGSIALLLFLILRESTLSHIRVRNGGSPPSSEGATRYQAGRRPAGAAGPAEAATAESSPPAAGKPPATPR